jgi:hypothetical protein
MNKKGYLTLAFGKLEYIELAKNLYKSYKIAGNKLPFAIATDSEDRELALLFDYVIKMNPTKDNNYSEKLNIYQYSPFEETVFIDSDCLIVKNIDFIWELLGINDVSAVKSFPERPNHFFSSKIVKEKYGVTFQPVLNGGVYFFKKNETAKAIFEKAKSFISEYDKLEMPRLNGRLNEEPLIALALGTENIHPVESKRIMFCTPGQSNFKLDLLQNKCSFLKYGVKVQPAIMHFAMRYTKGFHYTREIQKINLIFDKNKSALFTWLLINYMRNPRYIYRILMMRLRERSFKFLPLMPMLNDDTKLKYIQ